MSYFNHVTIMGNLGKDPDILKITDKGHFVRLSIATSKHFNNGNGERETDTQWHTVYLGNKIGSLSSQYLKKGDKVLITGELRYREWFDDAGNRHIKTAIYAKELKFLNLKTDKAVNDTETPYTQAMNEIRQSLGNEAAATH